MNIVAICRGAPGLGRVVPALALVQTLGATRPVTARFITYAAGARYLTARGDDVVDLGVPDGLFIDSVGPQALRVLKIIEQSTPDLVLIDGEFFLPTALAHLPVPVVYLANPHDLIGPANTFRRVNRLLLAYADAVLISSLSCPQPTPRSDLVPDTPCLEVPALTKDIPLDHHHRTTGPLRVLVTSGGGSLRSPGLRAATDTALAVVFEILATLVEAGEVGAVSVVLGADATLPAEGQLSIGCLRVIDEPVELANLYPHHDLLIARAGRNTAAEAAYCGIPTVLLPITADPHRAEEQAHNAAAMAHRPAIFPLPDWHDPTALRRTLTQALSAARRGIRPTGRRGNTSAAAYITRLLAEPASTSL